MKLPRPGQLEPSPEAPSASSGTTVAASTPSPLSLNLRNEENERMHATIYMCQSAICHFAICQSAILSLCHSANCHLPFPPLSGFPLPALNRVAR